jgi:hypothetical protein
VAGGAIGGDVPAKVRIGGAGAVGSDEQRKAGKST